MLKKFIKHKAVVSETPTKSQPSIPEEKFSIAEFARGSGMTIYKAKQVLEGLVKQGFVEKFAANNKNTLYQIIGGVPNAFKDTVPSSPQVNSEYVEKTKELIFEFIRATRSTDILVFLTWLEREGK